MIINKTPLIYIDKGFYALSAEKLNFPANYIIVIIPMFSIMSHIEQIEAAQDYLLKVYHQNSISYPFTGNDIMDELLTGWSIDCECGHCDRRSRLCNPPINKIILARLYQTERDQLLKFILAGDVKNDTVMQADPPTYSLVNTLLAHLDEATQWELVYLVLEFEDCGGSVNESLYPNSLFNLIDPED